jgi:hypothetical protein
VADDNLLISRYEIDKKIQIFMNDFSFQKQLEKYRIKLTIEDYRELVTLLLNNRITISEYSTEELNNFPIPFLRDELMEIFSKEWIEKDLYFQVMYTFKYSTIKTFFLDNYGYYLPEIDKLNFFNKQKMKLYQEAFMREFDRFSDIIDEIYNVVDIDKTPGEYLNYIAQSIGYEREDKKLLKDSSFRELIKNIIEVYKIKGTNYSFELFFNFLGFEAELKEFWFDKRYGDNAITMNSYTNTTNKNLHSFYLTPLKPTTYVLKGMSEPFLVSENSIIGTLDCNEFDVLCKEYGYRKLLGYEEGYDGQKYTYFKTNVIQFNLSSLRATSDQEDELSEEDIETINSYANFLTPIFIKKDIVINIKPFEDYAGDVLDLRDISRPDPRSTNVKNIDADITNNINDESMLHLYQGYRPSRYYWEDGLFQEYDSIGKPIGGHFINGFLFDTYNKIWSLENPDSVFYKIKYQRDFPWDIQVIKKYQKTNLGKNYTISQLQNKVSWTDEEIKQLISVLLSIKTTNSKIKNEESKILRGWENKLFEHYKIVPRDILWPFIDGTFDIPTVTITNKDELISSKPVFGMSREKEKDLFYEGSLFDPAYVENPEYFPNRFNRFKIDSVNENGEVVILDVKKRLDKFLEKNENEIKNSFVGNIKKGDVWITDITLGDEKLELFKSNTDYTSGNYIVFDGLTYLVIEDFNSGTYNYINPDWIGIKIEKFLAIRKLKKGMVLYKPDFLFDIEIIEIDYSNNKVKISEPSNETLNNFDFKIKKNSNNFIEINNSNKNDGIYLVKEIERIDNIKLKVTLDEKMKNDGKGGFLKIHKHKRKYKDLRYPFFFNTVEIKEERKWPIELNRFRFPDDYELLDSFNDESPRIDGHTEAVINYNGVVKTDDFFKVYGELKVCDLKDGKYYKEGLDDLLWPNIYNYVTLNLTKKEEDKMSRPYEYYDWNKLFFTSYQGHMIEPTVIEDSWETYNYNTDFYADSIQIKRS